MSTYREVELRCDGIEGDPYGCNDSVIHAHTGRRARKEARERDPGYVGVKWRPEGWLARRRRARSAQRGRQEVGHG